MRRAMVTGGGGFLGGVLVRQLLECGYRVRGFSRRPYPELEALGAEWQTGDLRDAGAVREACRDADIVFHTAAIAGVWGRWSTYYGINTLGTRNVIEGCRAAGVGKLVYTSSPSVTFSGGDQIGVDETVPYPDKFLAHYPHTKALAEREVLAADGTDLRTCALRPHLIWGPGDPHLVPRVIQRARQGKLRRIGDGQNLVDICYVDNAAAAHVQAAEELYSTGNCGGRAYFISQGEPVNCWGWIDELLALAGVAPLQGYLSYSAAYRIGWGLECLYRCLGKTSEPPMTRFVAAQLATSHYFDISAAQRDFGYTPRVTTEEGMIRLARTLRQGADENLSDCELHQN